MKTIANLTGVEFLKAVNKARHSVEKFLAETDVLKLWMNKPTFTGNETQEEKLKIQREQVKKNLNDILDTLLETHPQETYDLIMALCVREENAPEPDGMDILSAAFSLIGDKRVLDFLLQLAKLGRFGTDA